MSVKSGVPLSYDEYSSLLLAAASAYDDQHQPKKIKRHIINHTLYDVPEETDAMEPYDIDSSVSELHAYATKFGKINRPFNNRSNNIVKMSSDKWYSLDEKSRAIWDQIDNNAKSLILGYTSPSPLSRPQLNRSNGPS